MGAKCGGRELPGLSGREVRGLRAKVPAGDDRVDAATAEPTVELVDDTDRVVFSAFGSTYTERSRARSPPGR
jgi:hypothetical protein